MKPNLLDDPDFAPAETEAAKALLRAIQGELAADERLIWVGHPEPGRPTVGLPAVVRFLCLVVGGFAGLLAFVLILAGLIDRPHFVLVPFLLGLGLSLCSLILLRLAWRGVPVPPWLLNSGRRAEWVHKRLDRQACRICYGLTDRRVIIREPAAFGEIRVRSFAPQDLGKISRTERPDGSGNLFLEIVGAHPGGVVGPAIVGLFRIAGVRDVEALIRATLSED